MKLFLLLCLLVAAQGQGPERARCNSGTAACKIVTVQGFSDLSTFFVEYLTKATKDYLEVDAKNIVRAESFEDAIFKLNTGEADILAAAVEKDGPHAELLAVSEPLYGSRIVLVENKKLAPVDDVIFLGNAPTPQLMTQGDRAEKFRNILTGVKRSFNQHPRNVDDAMKLVLNGTSRFVGRYPLLEKAVRAGADDLKTTEIDVVPASLGVARSEKKALDALNEAIRASRNNGGLLKTYGKFFDKDTYVDPEPKSSKPNPLEPETKPSNGPGGDHGDHPNWNINHFLGLLGQAGRHPGGDGRGGGGGKGGKGGRSKGD